MPEQTITVEHVEQTSDGHLRYVSTTARASDAIPEILPPFAPRDPSGQLAGVRDVLERWHDDVGHAGSFRFCYERPCREIAGVMRGIEL